MGHSIAQYEVVAPIRSGGMATLYLARRRGVGGFSRLVALKLIHPHLLQDPAIIDLFLDEARIAAGIRHPNVVHVEEVGVHEGSYFIAMEYVHGVSLAQFLERLEEKRLRLSPRLCCWIIAQIAEALHAAHETAAENGTPLNIVHRDVSPQNVLIGHTGHVKLIDFGIAKCRTSSRITERGNAVLGKLRYMSPEQLRLEAVGRRSDLYALGVMFWEMLTSRQFLRCTRVDDPRDWETREQPPAPSRYMPQVRTALDRVALKTIAYDPNKRFPTAFDLRRALIRAEPATALVDAPRVASLLRTLMGDELDRRALAWPSTVTRELDLDASTSDPQAMEELTVEVDYARLGLSLSALDQTPAGEWARTSGPADNWQGGDVDNEDGPTQLLSDEELTAIKLPSSILSGTVLDQLGTPERRPYEETEEKTRVRTSASPEPQGAIARPVANSRAPHAFAQNLGERLHALYRSLPVGTLTRILALGLACLAAGTLVGVLARGYESTPPSSMLKRPPVQAPVDSRPTVLQLEPVAASPSANRLPQARAAAWADETPEPVSEAADAGVERQARP